MEFVKTVFWEFFKKHINIQFLHSLVSVTPIHEEKFICSTYSYHRNKAISPNGKLLFLSTDSLCVI